MFFMDVLSFAGRLLCPSKFGQKQEFVEDEEIDPFWVPEVEQTQHDEGFPEEDEERTERAPVREAIEKHEQLVNDIPALNTCGTTEYRLRDAMYRLWYTLKSQEQTYSKLGSRVDDRAPTSWWENLFRWRRDVTQLLDNVAQLLKELDEHRKFGGELDISRELLMTSSTNKMLFYTRSIVATDVHLDLMTDNSYYRHANHSFDESSDEGYCDEDDYYP